MAGKIDQVCCTVVNFILSFKRTVSHRLGNLVFWYIQFILIRKGKIDYYFCSINFCLLAA